MNQPIRKIGMQGREAVYLLNGEQRKLHLDFNPTTVYMGSTKGRFGETIHHFAPNRRERRASLQKQTPRQKYGPAFNRLQVEAEFYVDGEKVSFNDYCQAYHDGKRNLCSTKRKVIPHYN